MRGRLISSVRGSPIYRVIQSFFRKLILKMPAFLRSRFLRSLYLAETNLPRQLTIKRAETFHEIDEAFKIAQQSGVPFNKFHALPTTSVLVAKWKDEVIATVSIVLDTSFLLPMEPSWNLDELRKDSVRLAEITPLATKKGFKTQQKKWVLPLSKYIFDYCQKNLGVDIMVFAATPGQKDFMHEVFLFDPIEDLVPRFCPNVRGEKAIGYFLRIDGPAQEAFKVIYSGKSREKDLYKYFLETEFKNCVLPEKQFNSCGAYVFTPSMLDYFFNQQSEVFRRLNETERSTLSNIYFYPDYQAIIGQGLESSFERHQPRFTVLSRARFSFRASGRLMTATVLEVSRNGLKLRMGEPHKSDVGEDVSISVELSPQNNVTLRGKVLWVLPDLCQIGVGLENSIPEKWQEFVNSLEEYLLSRSQTSSADKKKA